MDGVPAVLAVDSVHAVGQAGEGALLGIEGERGSGVGLQAGEDDPDAEGVTMGLLCPQQGMRPLSLTLAIEACLDLNQARIRRVKGVIP